MITSEDPLVSVSLITYNQRELIARALDGVLAQRTDFPVEIIVGDDHSTDGTREILLDYQRRHPHCIFLILHPRRYSGEIAGRTNNITNLMACRGKYTAMLDGDDYWTDPLKLQRQVDILEARPEVVACAHDSRYKTTDGSPLPDYLPPTVNAKVGNPTTGVYRLKDIIPPRRVLIKPSTFVFRTRAYGQLPEWFWDVVMADAIHSFMVVDLGDLYYDERVMAVQTIDYGSFTKAYVHNVRTITRQIKDNELLEELFEEFAGNELHRFERNQLRIKLVRKLRQEKKYWPMLRQFGRAVWEEPRYNASKLTQRLFNR